MKRFFGFVLVPAASVFFSALTFAVSAHCDFNNDGYDDLAIGVPDDSVNGHPAAGAVQVLYGRAGGLSATNNQLWHKDSPNILGDAEDNELFGSALACGDFNGDGFADLAIGTPGGNVNNYEQAGSVTILYGSS